MDLPARACDKQILKRHAALEEPCHIVLCEVRVAFYNNAFV